MKGINKNKEPRELLQYRQKHGNRAYDGPDFTPVKDCVREALLEEQHSLCAYCMQRIAPETMKIEHWHSLKKHPDEQLVYMNLLACCKGNEGQPSRNQHCDTRKADEDLLYNPADKTHHPRLKIRYTADGTICSEDKAFDAEINHVLNLNWGQLKNNRKAVIQAVQSVLSAEPGKRRPNEISRLLKKWEKTDSKGKLQEYCHVAVYYLKKKWL